MSFEDSLKTILKFEGGFADNKNDPGGRTNFGVTQDTFDLYLRTKKLPFKDVSYIREDEVEAIYKGYYKGCRADVVELTHPFSSLCHFDCAINQGIGTSHRLLQMSINKCWMPLPGNGESDVNVYQGKVKEDGVIGSLTLKALEPIEDLALLKTYLNIRKSRYDNLLVTRPKMEEFRGSWYFRLNTIARKAELDWIAKIPLQ